jgi:effector-binding domain-containing protein
MMTDEQTGNDVELGQLVSQTIVSIRQTVPVAALGEAQGAMLSELSRYLRQRDAHPAGPPFVRYHSFGATETDLELGIPVADPMAGEGRVVSGVLPGGPAITLWHLGPHDDRLRDAYTRMQAWPNEHGRSPDGAPWEIYFWIDPRDDRGPDSWPAPSDWRTQLIQPVKEMEAR